MTIETRLAEIRARVENATEGPWESDGGGEIGQHWSRPEPWEAIVDPKVSCMAYCYGGSAPGVVNDADAEFIAASRTDLPKLLAAVEAVMELHTSSANSVGALHPDPACNECWQAHPCPTVQAITAALEVEG